MLGGGWTGWLSGEWDGAWLTHIHMTTCLRGRRQEAFKEGKAAKQAKEEYEWGRGLVQKEKDAEFRKELEDIKNAPFARSVACVVGLGSVGAGVCLAGD